MSKKSPPYIILSTRGRYEVWEGEPCTDGSCNSNVVLSHKKVATCDSEYDAGRIAQQLADAADAGQ